MTSSEWSASYCAVFLLAENLQRRISLSGVKLKSFMLFTINSSSSLLISVAGEWGCWLR